MCGKRTPVRDRLLCSCSHALLGGTLLVVALVAWFAATHLVLLLGVAGLVVAGTFAVVRRLMRHTLVYVRPAHAEVSPAPATPAQAPSAPDVIEAAEAITRAAMPDGQRR